jgi:hypothetical protein
MFQPQTNTREGIKNDIPHLWQKQSAHACSLSPEMEKTVEMLRSVFDADQIGLKKEDIQCDIDDERNLHMTQSVLLSVISSLNSP